MVNAVGGGNLGTEIDLYTAYDALNEYDPSYEPEQSPGIHFKLPASGVTAMIFRTGEYHLTGAKTVKQLTEASEELTKIIEADLNLHTNSTEPEVRNIVYKGNIGREIRLENLAPELDEEVQYDPSMHAGLLYRKDEWPGVITLYRTGAYTYTGANSTEKAEEVLESFNKEIEDILS